jgi:hypothetical protein
MTESYCRQNFTLNKEAVSYSEASITIIHWTIELKATIQILITVKCKISIFYYVYVILIFNLMVLFLPSLKTDN